MTPIDILNLVRDTVEMSKDYISTKGNTRGYIEEKNGKRPEYYPGYNAGIEEADKISVHSDTDVFPDRLFTDRSPNQTPEEFDYVKNNYKQITLPVFIDYINTITRPWHKSNWSITYAEDDTRFGEETLQAYLEDLPEWGSLEFFMRHIVPTIKTRDAEGVIAVKPVRIPVVLDEEGNPVLDEDGAMTIDEMQLIEPAPFYYQSWQVVSQSEHHYLIELEEKSVVHDGSREVKCGLVYEFYDAQNIWKIVQVGKRKDYQFEIKLLFNHAWDMPPVMRLGGVPTVCSNRLRYQSPFLYATDNLDLVTLNQSQLQISVNKCVYPVRVMVGNVCDFEEHGHKCNGGTISYYGEDGNAIHKSCPSCHGSGLKSRLSPMGEILLKPEDREGVGDSTMRTPLEYKAPEVTTLEFLRSEITEHEKRARKILHLKDSERPTGGDVTATEVMSDMKELAAFVSPISDQMFTLYEFLIDAIGYMRYGDAYEQPTIVKPTTFDYTTEEDYVNRIAVMTEANVPPMVIHMVMMQYLRTVYFNTAKQERVLKLIVATDRLMGVNQEEIRFKAARGGVAPWEDVLHCSAISLVKELEMANSEFFEQDLEEQQAQLITKAKEVAQQASGNEEADIVEGIVG